MNYGVYRLCFSLVPFVFMYELVSHVYPRLLGCMARIQRERTGCSTLRNGKAGRMRTYVFMEYNTVDSEMHLLFDLPNYGMDVEKG